VNTVCIEDFLISGVDFFGFERGGELCVDDEAHGLTCNEHGVISLGSGAFKTGCDVFGFEIRLVLKDFRLSNTSGQQIKHVFDPNPHASDAGASTTLVWVECDSTVHVGKIADAAALVKKVVSFNQGYLILVQIRLVRNDRLN
jgi:hypothetical protein